MERETKTIASNLKRLIYETGLSPAEVARQIGMSKATLSRWMTGERIPKMDNIDMLARYLGVTREQIVGKGEDKTKYQAVKIPVLGYVAAGIPLEMITGSWFPFYRYSKNYTDREKITQLWNGVSHGPAHFHTEKDLRRSSNGGLSSKEGKRI